MKEVAFMLPIRWDPFRDLGTLHREIDSLFRRTFGTLEEPESEATLMMSPKLNAFVKDNVYHVEAELPGIDREDLDVNIDGNILTLRGERKMSKETKEQDFLIRESGYGSFMRRLTLPDGVDAEKVQAKYDNGILMITMPMTKKITGGRKVLVEGGAGKSGVKNIH
jgi:HSP20 family protein